MGYSIIYQSAGSVKRRQNLQFSLRKIKKIKYIMMIGFALLAIMIGVFLGNTLSVKDLLLPGNGEVTSKALESMAENIAGGESVQTVLVSFCKEILGGAQ